MLPLLSLLRWARKLPSQEVRRQLFPFLFPTLFFFKSSLLLTCRVFSLSKLYFSLPRRLLPACLKRLVSLHSWLFLSSLRLSFSANSHYKIGCFSTGFVGGILKLPI